MNHYEGIVIPNFAPQFERLNGGIMVTYKKESTSACGRKPNLVGGKKKIAGHFSVKIASEKFWPYNDTIKKKLRQCKVHSSGQMGYNGHISKKNTETIVLQPNFVGEKKKNFFLRVIFGSKLPLKNYDPPRKLLKKN